MIYVYLRRTLLQNASHLSAQGEYTTLPLYRSIRATVNDEAVVYRYIAVRGCGVWRHFGSTVDHREPISASAAADIKRSNQNCHRVAFTAFDASE